MDALEGLIREHQANAETDLSEAAVKLLKRRVEFLTVLAAQMEQGLMETEQNQKDAAEARKDAAILTAAIVVLEKF